MRRCSKCILPETYPNIRFNEDGVCNVCTHFETKWKNRDYLKKESELKKILAQYSRKKRRHHCIVPISGGIDSTFILYLVREVYGLNPLAVNYDNGFQSKQARKNIENAINKLDVDYAIFGEPSGVKNITRGYKGKLGVKIICETETGHTSAPQIFNNAIEAAYELWSKIKTSSLEENKSHRSLYYSTTVCLINIRGGGVSGMIPKSCMFDFEVRMPPPSSNCQKSINWLNSIIQRYTLKNPKVKLTMKIIDKVEPFIAKKDSPLIRALIQAIKDTVGGPVRLLKKTGTGDMNIFAPNVKTHLSSFSSQKF